MEDRSESVELTNMCMIQNGTKIKDNKRYIVLLYKANDFEGQIKSSKEGEIFWIERTDLRNYSLPENFAEMLQIFENNQLSEIDYHPVGSDYSGEWITETY